MSLPSSQVSGIFCLCPFPYLSLTDPQSHKMVTVSERSTQHLDWESIVCNMHFMTQSNFCKKYICVCINKTRCKYIYIFISTCYFLWVNFYILPDLFVCFVFWGEGHTNPPKKCSHQTPNKVLRVYFLAYIQGSLMMMLRKPYGM